jgi:hypothetical protein
MTEPITIPDATREPDAYRAALLSTLGDRDPLEVYAGTPDEVGRLCDGLAGADWLVPPATDEWNALQIVGHLFDVDIVYGFRWRLSLTESEPAYPGYDEKRWSELARPPVDQLLTAFGALRRVNVDLMRQLRPADWERTGIHGEQGKEDVATMLGKVAGHDLAHLNQLQRTIEALPARVAD